MNVDQNKIFIETSWEILRKNLEERCFEEADRIITHVENQGFAKEAWDMFDELKAARNGHDI